MLKYRSVAVVGMEKNCGKTECLNYILRRLPSDGPGVCVTSIGLDGERTDQVTGTAKPEIILRSGMFFATSETHYRSRRLVSEIPEKMDGQHLRLWNRADDNRRSSLAQEQRVSGCK